MLELKIDNQVINYVKINNINISINYLQNIQNML